MTDAWLVEIQARFDRAAHSAGIGRLVARLDLEAHAETDLELLLAEVERLCRAHSTWVDGADRLLAEYMTKQRDLAAENATCRAERAHYGDVMTERMGLLEAEVERLRRVGALVAASAMSVHPTTRAAADTLSEVERLRAANDRVAFEVEALREERAALQARVSALKRQCRGAVAGCRRVMTQLRAVRRSRR